MIQTRKTSASADISLATPTPRTAVLGIPGFNYGDLYDPLRLKDLLAVFDQSIRQHDPRLFAEFESYRTCQGQGMQPQQISDLLVRMAPFVGMFMACLFKVTQDREHQIALVR